MPDGGQVGLAVRAAFSPQGRSMLVEPAQALLRGGAGGINRQHVFQAYAPIAIGFDDAAQPQPGLLVLLVPIPRPVAIFRAPRLCARCAPPQGPAGVDRQWKRRRKSSHAMITQGREKGCRSRKSRN